MNNTLIDQLKLAIQVAILIVLTGCNQRSMWNPNTEIGVDPVKWFCRWDWLSVIGIPVLFRDPEPTSQGVRVYFLDNQDCYARGDK